MEIWIRSQSKIQLFKMEYAIVSPDEDSGYMIYNEDYVFGKYLTRERALEVLDDIQYELSKRGLGQPNYTGVYEMPEN